LGAQPEKTKEGSEREGVLFWVTDRKSKSAADGSSMPPPTRTLRKAVMIGMVGEGATVLEKFQILRDCGFEGAELDSPSSTPADEILAAMDKTGLKVHGLVDSVHWQFHLNDPDEGARQKAIEALETALRDGKKFGSVSVLLVPAVVDKRLP